MSARIAVVGDLDPSDRTHAMTNASLDHVELGFEWVPTDAIGGEASGAGAPHPLLTGFAAAARSFAEARSAPPRQRGHA
jgi:hypothetical protein